MLRDTQIITLTDNVGGSAGAIRGMEVVYYEMRDPLPGDCLPYGVGHPSARPYGFGPQGWANPGGRQSDLGPPERLESEVRYLWAPTLISVSVRIVNADGEVSMLSTDEVLVDFIAYDVMQGIKNGPYKTADYLVAREAVNKQPIAGFTLGDAGARNAYATNAGHGYRFPRQANYNRNECAAQYFRVFPLVMTWDYDDQASGAVIVDTEWRLEQV